MPTCDDVRLAVSARLDGETSPLAPAQVDDHLRTCAHCADYATGAAALDLRLAASTLTRAPLPGPDLLPAMVGPARRHARRRRVLLALLGSVHLVLGAVELLAAGPGAGHATREVAAWSLALAVGFLAAAWRPSLSRGLLPVAATAAVVALAVTVPDLLAARIGVADQVVHLSQAVGALVLWRSAQTPALDGPVFA